MERHAAQDAYADLHENAPFHDGTFTSWSKKRAGQHRFHFSHGVTIGVADHDLTPWDPFTTDRDASPVPPDPEESSEE